MQANRDNNAKRDTKSQKCELLVEAYGVGIECTGDPLRVDLFTCAQDGSRLNNSWVLTHEDVLKLAFRILGTQSIADLVPHASLPAELSPDAKLSADERRKGIGVFRRSYREEFGSRPDQHGSSTVVKDLLNGEEITWGDALTVKRERQGASKFSFTATGPLSMYLVIDVLSAFVADNRSLKDYDNYAVALRRWGEKAFVGAELREGVPLHLTKETKLRLIEDDDELDEVPLPLPEDTSPPLKKTNAQTQTPAAMELRNQRAEERTPSRGSDNSRSTETGPERVAGLPKPSKNGSAVHSPQGGVVAESEVATADDSGMDQQELREVKRKLDKLQRDLDRRTTEIRRKETELDAREAGLAREVLARRNSTSLLPAVKTPDVREEGLKVWQDQLVERENKLIRQKETFEKEKLALEARQKELNSLESSRKAAGQSPEIVDRVSLSPVEEQKLRELENELKEREEKINERERKLREEEQSNRSIAIRLAAEQQALKSDRKEFDTYKSELEKEWAAKEQEVGEKLAQANSMLQEAKAIQQGVAEFLRTKIINPGE